jgi:hypothetical protein
VPLAVSWRSSRECQPQALLGRITFGVLSLPEMYTKQYVDRIPEIFPGAEMWYGKLFVRLIINVRDGHMPSEAPNDSRK